MINEVAALNALGDLTIVAAALYAAYTLRKLDRAPINLGMIALSFLIGASVFARNAGGVEYYAPMAFRFIIFAVFMVELTLQMVRGAEKLRGAYVLYVLMVLPAALGTLSSDTVLLFYGSTIMISYLMAAACFSVLIDSKRGEAQSLAFIGFLGAVFPIVMIVYNPSILLAPWNFLFLLGKILLAVFFLGLALHSRRDARYFFWTSRKAGGKRRREK